MQAGGQHHKAQPECVKAQLPRALLTKPRPLPPHVKHVSPLLAAPPQPLPPDLESFITGDPAICKILLQHAHTCSLSCSIHCAAPYAASISNSSHSLVRDEQHPTGAGEEGVVLAAFGSMMNVKPQALIALAKLFASCHRWAPCFVQ